MISVGYFEKKNNNIGNIDTTLTSYKVAIIIKQENFYTSNNLRKIEVKPSDLNNDLFEMAAVIRIKRRLEDEPLEALILNCKRQKTDNSSTEILPNTPELSSTVLTLAGTIKEVS